MRPRPASRRWVGRNHCGGPRAAAEPVAEAAVLTIEPGPGFVARLREALRDAPAAQRIMIPADFEGTSVGPAHHPPPLWDAVNHPPPLGEGGVGVGSLAVSDTVKEVVDGRVRRTVPRETLVQLIGPWIFDRHALVDALTRVVAREAEITDMIRFCEAARLRVRVLPVR